MTDSIQAVEVKSPEMLKLIDNNAAVEKLCTGFWFTEGPIWNPKEQCLYFSDMPGDVRRRWSARDGVKEVRKPSNKCNGMTYDAAAIPPMGECRSLASNASRTWPFRASSEFLRTENCIWRRMILARQTVCVSRRMKNFYT